MSSVVAGVAAHSVSIWSLGKFRSTAMPECWRRESLGLGALLQPLFIVRCLDSERLMHGISRERRLGVDCCEGTVWESTGSRNGQGRRAGVASVRTGRNTSSDEIGWPSGLILVRRLQAATVGRKGYENEAASTR